MSTLAILGVGRWGKNYIKAVENIPKINLKYLCASQKKTLESFNDKYVKVYNFKDLLRFKDIDGIIIATPSSTHYTLAKFFLSKGYNLLIEKPLTTNYDHAEELGKIYQRVKSITMVGHVYLYNTAYLKFKEKILEIGTIQYLEFEGCNFGPFPKNSSALWEWAPHDVAMCLDILSKFPVDISVWAVGKDMVYARLRFKNTQAFMKLGWLSPVKRRRVTIVGSKSSIIFDDTLDKKIIFYENVGSDFATDKEGLNNNFYPRYPKYFQEEPIVSELKEFVDCLKKKKKPRTDLEHGLAVIKVIQSMKESINNNGKIIYV